MGGDQPPDRLNVREPSFPNAFDDVTSHGQCGFARYVRDELVVVAGFEDNTKSPGKARADIRSGAESGAVRGEIAPLADTELTRIVAVWPTLSDAVRGAIMDLVNGVPPYPLT
jgi:hypothetical protein